MCGIVGQLFKNKQCDPLNIRAMRDSLIHRGPDDAGEWYSSDCRVGFGHRRLAVIDLSMAGHQPMIDESGRFCVVFNGEIYNFKELRCELSKKGHVFKTETDTEVILASYREWEEECPKYFVGMFVIALYDTKKKQLFLARDRAGEKPLYYKNDSNSFEFASELKALIKSHDIRRKVNLEAFDFYLAYGYIPRDLCILEGIKKLPAAHAMIVNLQNNIVRKWKYWNLSLSEKYWSASPNDLTEELETLLKQSISQQLVADVPVGILLSGGIDSSIITAIASSVYQKRVRTFTIIFPEHRHYNEGPYAKIVAKHFNTEHNELVAEPATVDLLPTLSKQFDEPLADSSIVPTYLVSRLIREHCTVALGGDGGDELFGGYPSYNWIFKQEFIRHLFPLKMRNAFSKVTQKSLPIGLKGRNHLVGCGGKLSNAVAHFNLFFDSVERKQLVPALRENKKDIYKFSEKYKMRLCPETFGIPSMAMYLDYITYLPDDLLVKVDRASMLNSLEVRAPFLDYRIIEFAFNKIPNSLRANHDKRKILLRNLGSRLLPPSLDLSRKQGFSIPLSTWIKGDWGRYMRDVLNNLDNYIFDKKMIGRLWKNQKIVFRNTHRIFAIVMFELWRRHYKVSFN